jgi:HPt (histidine-containing phosphotransfer) domain-containing protein
MNDVIKKPVEPELMFITLATWIRGLHRGEFAHIAADDDALPGSAQVDSPHVDALPIWDPFALQKVIGSNTASQARLLTKFLSIARATIQETLQAIEIQDWAAAAALGHKLKSSARSVGAMQFGTLCEALERAGETWNASQYERYGSLMQVAFEEVNALIEGHLLDATESVCIERGPTTNRIHHECA